MSQEVCNNGIDDDGDGKIDLQDEDCQCNGLFTNIREQSIILNHSFEQKKGCPTGFSQMTLVDSWVQPSEGTSDYLNTCSTFDPSKEVPEIGPMPLPIPDGSGAVGIIDGHLDDIWYKGPYKEYVGTVLNAPLRQNQTYVLELSVGFGFDASKLPPLELTVFGHGSRDAFPIDYRAECPSKYFPDWKILGSQQVGGSNEWVKTSIEFTCPTDIHSIAIGPSCQDASDSLNYYYLDNLILYRKQDKGKVWINIVESPICDNTITLASNAIDQSYTYQWYKNGIALPNAKKDSIVLKNKEKDNGQYQLMISSGTTCQLSEPFDYEHIIKKRNFADLGSDIITCSQNSITLSVPEDSVQRTGRYYLWSDGTNGQELVVTKSGLYWLELRTVTPGYGETVCHGRDSIMVSFEAKGSIDLGPDKYLCDGFVEIGGEIANGSHKWSTGETTSKIVVNAVGTYYDTVEVDGCMAVGEVKVNNNPLTLDLGEDVETCEGTPVKFAPNVPAGSQVLWNKQYIGANYTVLATGTVIAEAEYEGCYKSDTVNVLFNASPKINLGNDTIVCENIKIILDASAPQSVYEWNTGSTEPTISPDKSGKFSVRATGSNGCYSDDTINISFQSLPRVELGKDISLCRGESINLTPSVAHSASFLWNDGLTAASRSISLPGKYYLQASNNCGSAIDSIVIKDGGICALIFPNAFTPNRDGKNDLFPGNKTFEIDNYSLQIFNRWGQMIFHSKNPTESWDGYIKGRQAPSGSYIWKVAYNDRTTGEGKSAKGHVLLIR